VSKETEFKEQNVGGETEKKKTNQGKPPGADITRLTRRLGDEIAAVYGFDIPKQRVSQERSER